MNWSDKFNEAKRIGDSLRLDLCRKPAEQISMGQVIEPESETKDPATNVINDETGLAGKIALAHVKE